MTSHTRETRALRARIESQRKYIHKLQWYQFASMLVISGLVMVCMGLAFGGG